jgi:hypothetical protein
VQGRRLVPIVVAAVMVAVLPIDRAVAAPMPDAWCGHDEVVADRPDVVGQHQIHVVYVQPADRPNRFGESVVGIARDLAAVDSWWQGQDPTRIPRFDFASFPGCGSEFGALDVSSASFGPTLLDWNARGPLINDLYGAGFVDETKKYLVYYRSGSCRGLRTLARHGDCEWPGQCILCVP